MTFFETIKRTIKNWKRHPLNTIISFVSITVGLTSCIVLSVFITDELLIANSFNQNKNIYLLSSASSFSEDVEMTDHMYYKYALAIAEATPEIEEIVFFSGYTISLDSDSDPEYVVSFATVPEAADLLNFAVISGDLKKTLGAENEIAVIKSFAEKRYGTAEVMGEIIKYTKYSYSGDEHTVIPGSELLITYIIDDSRTPILDFETLTSLPDIEEINTPYSTHLQCFVKLNGLSDSESVVKNINELLLDRSNTDFSFITRIELFPLNKLYFSGISLGKYGLINNRDKSFIYISLTLFFVLLFISCFNYINLSLVRISEKLKLTSTQRILGAAKSDIRRDVLKEITIQTLVCLIISVYFLYLILPQFNTFTGTGFILKDLFTVKNILTVITVIILIISIPFFYLIYKIDNSTELVLARRGISNGKK